MNFIKRVLRWLSDSIYILISSGSISSAVEDISVSIEVIPREVTDIKVGFHRPALFVGRLGDDASDYKSLNHAVGDAEHIGFRFLDYVMAENLFFFFSESTESLQLAFTAFIVNYGIVYNRGYFMQYCSCPKGADDYYRKCKGQRDIWAIVLCKVENTETFQDPIWEKQQKSSDYGNCYKIGWGELQKINKILYDAVFHTHNDNPEAALKP
jgi:hypothetical protein